MNQNDTTTILPKEIMAAVRWALRARGVAAGYARPVGELVLAAELATGTGLAHLLAFLQNEPPPLAKLELLGDEGNNGRLDLHHHDPLLFATAAFDLAWARACQRGWYALELVNGAASWSLLEPLLRQMAARGSMGQVVANGRSRYALPTANDAIVVEYLPVGIDLPPLPETAVFTILCQPHEPIAGLPTTQIEQRAAQWQRAQREGMEVETAVWEQIKAIANEILVPVA